MPLHLPPQVNKHAQRGIAVAWTPVAPPDNLSLLVCPLADCESCICASCECAKQQVVGGVVADLGAPGTAIAVGALQLPGNLGCFNIRFSCVPSCPCNTKKMQLLNCNIFWALQQVCKLLAQQGLLSSSAMTQEENMRPVVSWT